MPGLADVLRDALPSSASPAAKRAAEALRETYRSGASPTSLAIADSESAAAHAAYRMPATHAAVGAALAAATTKVPLWHLGSGTPNHLGRAVDALDGVALVDQQSTQRARAATEIGITGRRCWRDAEDEVVPGRAHRRGLQAVIGLIVELLGFSIPSLVRHSGWSSQGSV